MAGLPVCLRVRIKILLYLLLGIGLVLLMPERNFQPFAVEHAGESRPIRGFKAMAATVKESTRVIRGKPALAALALVEFFFGMSSEGFDRLGDPHLLQDFVMPAIGPFKPVVWFSILALSTNLLSLGVTHLLRRRFEAITTNRGLTARVLLVFNLIMAGSGIGFALAGNFPLAVTYLMIQWLVGSLSWPLFSAFLIQNIPQQVRATVMSMTGQSNALGQILGGPLVGVIGQGASLRAALVVAGLLLTPISALYARISRNGTALANGTELAKPVEVEAAGAETAAD